MFLCKNFLKPHMYSWQNGKYGVLLRWNLNSAKIYRYVYDLIVKTDQASHNGIFVFAFVSLQIKIVCGIQNIFHRRRRISNGNKHTERFRRGIVRDWFLRRNQRRSFMLPSGWSVSPQTHVFGNSEKAANRLRRMGKSEDRNYRRSLPIEISWRKIMGRSEFADENSYTVRAVGWLRSVGAILVQTEGVTVPHWKSVRTKLRDFIVNENPCHTWTAFSFRRAKGSYMALRCL